MIGFKFLSYWITVHLIVYDNLKKKREVKHGRFRHRFGEIKNLIKILEIRSQILPAGI